MKIKTRLTISTIISVSLALTIGVVILLSTYKVNQKAEYTKKTDELSRLINELKFLTDEYFLRNVERVQPQWESRFQSISLLLRSLESEGYVAKEVINEMQEDHKYIRKTFDKLVLAYERKEKSDQEFAELLLEYKERLAGQLITALNELIYDSIQLSQVLEVEINTTKTKTMWFIILFVITMVSVTGIISFMARRSISKSIIKLQEGAKVIGSGNLNTRINIDSKDEMGELAVTFNQMAEDLMESNSKLKESEEKSLLLLNSTGEGIYGLDLEGNCTFCNTSCLCLLGYEDESQLLRRNMHALIHHTRKDGTPYPEEECCIYQAFREGKGTHVDDEVLWRADGTSFAAEYRSFPIFHEGETVGSVVSFVNITERKKVEEHVHAQHAVTQVLAEATTLNEASLKILQIICTALEWDLGEIWAYDRQSGMLKCSEIWHIPSVEVPEFEKITRQTTFSPGVGLPGRVILSAQPVWIADVVHDENFPRASVATKEGLHGAFGFPILSGSKVLGTISFYSREIRKPDKDLLDMMTAIGSQIGLFVRRKQAEETLLQSEKLKAMGMMTSGVAHDFNNILAIISGHTQLLEENYKDDKELTDIIRTIYKATNDGAGIVRRMRQFTKMDRDTSKFVSVNIKEVLEEAVDFLKPRWMNIAIARGKPFYMDMDGIREIPSILGNPSELREVFINIINNAMDAMSEGGLLSFRTCTEEDTVFVSITDTGEGMTEEVKKRIYDPFFTTKRAEGSGLGMSEVYGIVTGHGGKIDISSEVGKGTTFTLKFPIATETIQEEELPVPGRKTTTKKLRILVVDDEKDICNIMNTLFSRNGHDVKAVTSGKEAINLIKSEEFDLVLSDLVMPGLSGHDVIQALDELDKRPKVGLITGWKEEIGNKDKEELNVDFIIRKPFDLSEITSHINDLFEI